MSLTDACPAEPVAGIRAEPFPADAAPARRGRLATTLAMRHAGPRRLSIAWECAGPDDAPLLVVAGGLSAGRHVVANRADAAPGWWEAQAGSLDLARHRVLAIQWLGAGGELDAPIDSADQADAIAAVLDHLGIARAIAFVGASYGAMVGLQFAARHPRRLGALLAISGAHRPHPYASALRSLQRRILRTVPAPTGGADNGAAAVSLARQLALLSYRTPEEFAERFPGPAQLRGGRAVVAADAYLQACGARDAIRFNAVALLRLSESLDLHAVDPAEVRTPTTLVAVAEDRLVPSADLHALAAALGATCRLHHLRSRVGHDAFLVEHAGIGAIVAGFLRGVAT
jgi:homoserine O-acetyltransferase